MGRVLLFVLAALCLLIGLVWQVPLSYTMKQSGVAAHGLSWEQARGTIWAGEVTGAGWKGTPVGAAGLKLKPLSPLSGRLEYDILWRGPMGQGSGDAAFSSGGARAKDLKLNIALGAIPALRGELRNIDATVRLMDGSVHIKKGVCSTAKGTITTDLVRLGGEQLRRTWPDLTGNITCDQGELILPLTGAAASGERFSITVRMGLAGRFGLTARVEGADIETENALALYGFTYENGAYVLRR